MGTPVGVHDVNVNETNQPTANIHVTANQNGTASATTNVTNNGILSTIVGIAAGALSVIGGLYFLANSGKTESDTDHIYHHTEDGFKNSKGERPFS